MTMPMFTAEASLDSSAERFQAAATERGVAGAIEPSRYGYCRWMTCIDVPSGERYPCFVCF